MKDKRDNLISVGDIIVYMIIPFNCAELTTGTVVSFTELMVRIDTGKLDNRGKPHIHLRYPDKVMVIPK